MGSENMGKSILSVILIIMPAIYFGNKGLTSEMGLCIVAGAIAASFLHIDKFSRFKGAGFEAELKEVVSQAYATIDEMKKISKPLLVSQIHMLVFHNRIDGLNFSKKMKSFEQMNEIAKMLSLDKDNEYIDAKNMFFRYSIWECFSRISDAIRNSSTQVGEQGKVKEFEQIKIDILTKLYQMLNYDSDVYPTIEQINEVIKPIEKDLGTNVRIRIAEYSSIIKDLYR